ncbi:MAG TPA: serine/threonine-protein kinase [Archangium sp.]|uniref:serine/threonine-protein kinase n=1 Tax=Archangium sp. TaxID=1872627 RepID=UPI002E32D949|nr:serine/threonine-protein kinase [Archangium sp.]HEX5745100.1 serine/threonine-protein kinase [Archangium sp.]
MHHLWRQDDFSVTWSVERDGERRLLRMALRPPGSREGPKMERFLEREAGALRRVQHACVPRLHEDGRWPDPVHGFRYLLMDHVEGAELTDMRRRGVTALQITRMMMQLAQAVDAMRRAGVNHGAIGPKNILMRDADSPPMLVDFSLADWPGNTHPPEHYPLAGFGGLDTFLRENPDIGFQVMPLIRGKRYLS